MTLRFKNIKLIMVNRELIFILFFHEGRGWLDLWRNLVCVLVLDFWNLLMGKLAEIFIIRFILGLKEGEPFFCSVRK